MPRLGTNDEKDPALTENSPLLAKSSQESSVNVPERSDEFSHLPDHEATILRKQVVVNAASANFFSLYRYATFKDKLILAVGFLLAIVSGVLRPLMTVLVGNVAQVFVTYRPMMDQEYEHYNGTEFYNGTDVSNFNGTDGQFDRFESSYSPEEFQRQINTIALYFVGLAVTDLISSTVDTFIFINRGEVISNRIRKNYLSAVLRQNIAYFDKLGSGEITARISTDTLMVQEGMSEKVSQLTSNITTFLSAMFVAFFRSWKLALILVSITVCTMVTLTTAGRFMVKFYRRSLAGYSVGGTIAEEVLSSIRNAQAFAIEDRLALEYDEYLIVTEKWAHKAGMVLGFMSGAMWFFAYCNYALGFFQGSRFLASGYLEVRQVLSTLMAMMMGSFFLSNIAPLLRQITSGISAASKIYTAIDRDSAIDPFVPGLTIPSHELTGRVEFRDVKMIYPSRPQRAVLENFNLTIESGKTVALVGASGSGKSTVIGLLERFYSPVGGHVFLDSYDITQLSVEWLRQNIALVSQEPVLFGGTIAENIAYGLIGTKFESASIPEKEALVLEACDKANATAFIKKLPLGLNTYVGDRGFLLSGGQKQRIAIARAIVSNPRILLLDEATSALDTKSEGVVQAALDAASKGRTTIVIAHRLSTIKDADQIIVMSNGKIVETGTHTELVNKGGEYYELVQAQKIKAADESSGESEVDSDTDSDVTSNTDYSDSSDLKLDEKASLARTKTNHSISSVLISKLPGEPEPKEDSIWTLIMFLVSITKGQNRFLAIGIICAVINGLGHPSIAVLYALSITAFRSNPDGYEDTLSKIRVYSGVFFALGVLQSSAFFLCNATLSFIGQRLVRRIRYMTFRHFLRQDMKFFDRKENTSGKLTAVLSQDAQSVEGLSGATLGQILNALFNVVAGSILSLAIAPKMAIVFVACVPLMIACGYGRFSMLARVQGQAKRANEESAAYACESVSLIRTVASLTREREIVSLYEESLAKQASDGKVPTMKSALLYGSAQGLQFLVTSLGFWWGSRFIKSGQYSTIEFYIAFMTAIFGSQNAGIVFSYAGDMTRARAATQSIKNLFERQPEIDRWSDEGEKLDSETVRGDIEFRGVHFRYPTRPSIPVLRGLNLKVNKGEYIALVGASGCGKSTTISLIEQFYRPLAGQVLLDDKDISTLNINNYRSHIALVQQEPILYATTIRGNVALGSLDPEETISDERVIAACKKSNIHDFIMSLPDGYNSVCGAKGVLLSGGQKQRIAIARALIREPKVLLLDEATSALDSESEKAVQAALDEAAKGRTTIAVAHRLSTIQNANRIYVFDDGRIAEEGTHSELLEKRGKYFDLVQAQALENLN